KAAVAFQQRGLGGLDARQFVHMDLAVGAPGVEAFRGWVERSAPEASRRLRNLLNDVCLGGIESEGHDGSCLLSSPQLCTSSRIACAFSSARYTGREPM